MKLSELLTKISPLPWSINGDAIAISTEEAMSNAAYSCHAANVLPELINELRVLVIVGKVDVEIINEVLARANEVITD